MPDTPAPRPAPQNPVALAALHTTYCTLHGRTHWHRWTRAEALTLGRLFVAAWGQGPRQRDLQTWYAMPQGRTITALFGSLAAYRAAIEEEGPLCVSSVKT